MCLVLAFTLSTGCYEHHTRAGDSDAQPSTDSGRDGPVMDAEDPHVDASHDGGPVIDGSHMADGHVGDAQLDASIDAGPLEGCYVPRDFPTIQAALDEPSCATIVVTEDQAVSTVTIARDVTITAPEGTTRVRVMGDGTGSVLFVDWPAVVTLQRLEIRGGVAGQIGGGGGILSTARLTLRDVTIADNTGGVGDKGGGLSQDGGSLQMTGSVTFARNRAGASTHREANGGALFINNSDVTFDGALSFEDNEAEGQRASGGAVFLQGGSFSGTGVIMRRNAARGRCGMLPAGGAFAAGGAMAGSGSVHLTSSTFADNQAIAEAQGMCAATALGGAFAIDVQIEASLATQNRAQAVVTGSGVFAIARGGFVAGNTTLGAMTALEGNSARATAASRSAALALGGAIYCPRCSIAQSILRFNGAAIDVAGERPDPSVYEGLHGALGGAIWSQSIDLLDSQISSNVASVNAADNRGGAAELAAGGGVALMSSLNANAAARITRSSVLGNNVLATGSGVSHAAGGGIVIDDAALHVMAVASTIAANRAQAGAANQTGVAQGGGVAFLASSTPGSGAELSLYNVTMVANAAVATDGRHGGIGRHAAALSQPTPMVNSILWGNTVNEVADDCCDGCVTGTHNIAESRCFASLDLSNLAVDPLLANPPIGGDQICIAFPLSETSPARDAGNSGLCLSPPDVSNQLDQCGNARQGDCDIGALEAP